MKSILIDIKGERFGTLIVIERGDNVNDRVCWICKCDCGNFALVGSSKLINGRTKSCGCRKRGSRTHGTIYGLYDNHNKLMYVGQTMVFKLSKRLKGHLEQPSIKMKEWFGKIDYVPEIKPIMQNIPIKKLNWLEQMTINWFSRKTLLLNSLHVT